MRCLWCERSCRLQTWTDNGGFCSQQCERLDWHRAPCTMHTEEVAVAVAVGADTKTASYSLGKAMKAAYAARQEGEVL